MDATPHPQSFYNPEFHFVKIPTKDLVLPLRYYKGWDIEFVAATETFQSPLLCLYGFQSSKDLEKAMDFAIAKRG